MLKSRKTPPPLSQTDRKKDGEHLCGALMRLLHLSLICKMSRVWNAFQKKTHHFRLTLHRGHSLQTYLNIARERQIRSVIQIETTADVAKCKRAVFWLTDDLISLFGSRWSHVNAKCKHSLRCSLANFRRACTCAFLSRISVLHGIVCYQLFSWWLWSQLPWDHWQDPPV